MNTIGIVVLGACVLATPPVYGQALSPIQKLAPADGAAGDQFGLHIAMDGNLVVIGAPLDDDFGNASGAAYVFDHSTGTQIVKLAPDDSQFLDKFGGAIDLHQGIVVAGIINERGAPSLQIGEAFLFDALSGEQLHRLEIPGIDGQDLYGRSVAIGGGVAAVGAPGRNTVFLFDVVTGALIDTIERPNGGAGDSFGRGLAIDGSRIAISSLGSYDGFGVPAEVYVYDLDTMDQLATLTPAVDTPADSFGWSVDLDAGVVAVNSYVYDGSEFQTAIVHLFDWEEESEFAQLERADESEQGWFGLTFALDNGLVVAGAGFEDALSGAAYVFDASSGRRLATLRADDAEPGDFFGLSPAIDGGTIVVGAFGDTHQGVLSGSAYVFNFTPCSPADLAPPFDQLDFTDVLAFLAAFTSSEPEADLAEPFGVLDFSDVSAFLTSFGLGCP